MLAYGVLHSENICGLSTEAFATHEDTTAYAVVVDILEEGSAGKPPVFLVESLSKLDDDEAVKAP